MTDSAPVTTTEAQMRRYYTSANLHTYTSADLAYTQGQAANDG